MSNGVLRAGLLFEFDDGGSKGVQKISEKNKLDVEKPHWVYISTTSTGTQLLNACTALQQHDLLIENNQQAYQ